MKKIAGFQLAHAGPPAGGAPLEDVIAATAVALVAVVLLAVVAIRFRRGGVAPLRRLGGAVGRLLGLPAWVALPALVCSASLLVAVFGYYWDVATHIDNGRDQGPFANPAHFPILFGLAGVALAGYLAVLLCDGCETRRGVRVAGWTIPLGGLLLLVSGALALAGFPLDDLWHRLFGQDVTLWGPTHIQMVGGASLATLALWVLLAEGNETAPESRGRFSFLRKKDPVIAGAFLVALSTLQGEFDFGVPQFRLVYQPILLMLAASIGLVVARMCLGKGGALKAALVFVLLRGLISLAVGPGLGRITMHFPLYLIEAGVVELVAVRVSPERRVVFGVAAGVGIGTLGLAAEWAWSHLWMPIPWPAELVPEALVLGLAAAIAGGVLGGLVGRSLLGDGRGRVPSWIPITAGAAAIACLAWPAPMGSGPEIRARVTLREEKAGTGRVAVATVRLDPADAADDAVWFHALAWQGLDWERGESRLEDVMEVGDGVYRTSEPVPVGGAWKSMLRLHVDNRLLALPLYLPEDRAIPAARVPARPDFERSFVTDKEIVQREAITTNVGLQRIGYSVLLVIGVVWIGVFAWALARLVRRERTGPRSTVHREISHARS